MKQLSVFDYLSMKSLQFLGLHYFIKGVIRSLTSKEHVFCFKILCCSAGFYMFILLHFLPEDFTTKVSITRSSALLPIGQDLAISHSNHSYKLCVPYSMNLILVFKKMTVMWGGLKLRFPCLHWDPWCAYLMGQEQAGHLHVVRVV